MASFRQKKISRGKTLADKLRQERISKEISLEEASQATKIQLKYLEILEEGNYLDLPGDIYAKAWIRLYADFLGLDSKELLVDYKIEKSVSDKLSKIDKKNKPQVAKDYSFLKPRVIKIITIGFLVFALLGYLGWEIKNIITPPEVIVFEPPNNFKTTENSVVVSGKTQPEVNLTINNETVLLNEEGEFSQTVNLAIGLNNLKISAKKKHSKINNLELTVFRENLN